MTNLLAPIRELKSRAASIRWEGNGFYIWANYTSDLPNGGWIRATSLNQLESVANYHKSGWNHYTEENLAR